MACIYNSLEGTDGTVCHWKSAEEPLIVCMTLGRYVSVRRVEASERNMLEAIGNSSTGEMAKAKDSQLGSIHGAAANELRGRGLPPRDTKALPRLSCIGIGPEPVTEMYGPPLDELIERPRMPFWGLHETKAVSSPYFACYHFWCSW